MARQRTTVDVWIISTNSGFGDGWEEESEEYTRRSAKEQARCYGEDCSVAWKQTKHRKKRSEYSSEQLAEIEQQILRDDALDRADRKARWELRRQARAAVLAILTPPS